MAVANHIKLEKKGVTRLKQAIKDRICEGTMYPKEPVGDPNKDKAEESVREHEMRALTEYETRSVNE